MRPESFPTDDSLGRSVQSASAPLSAKEGAFGEENAPYEAVFGDVSKIIDAARESAVRSVNAAMTAAYWLIGRRIVEFEQSGGERAEYGGRAHRETGGGPGPGGSDGASPFRTSTTCVCSTSHISPTGFSRHCLGNWPHPPRRRILQTPPGESDPPSVEGGFDDLLTAFPLPWSAYVRLLSVRNESARQFYETEALRGGWSVRQLDRQIGSQFYERTALSKNRAAMLTGGRRERPRRHRASRRADQGPLRPGVPRPQGRVLRERPGGGAHPPPGDLPPGAGRRLLLHRQAEAAARRRPVVPGLTCCSTTGA